MGAVFSLNKMRARQARARLYGVGLSTAEQQQQAYAGLRTAMRNAAQQPTDQNPADYAPDGTQYEFPDTSANQYEFPDNTPAAPALARRPAAPVLPRRPAPPTRIPPAPPLTTWQSPPTPPAAPFHNISAPIPPWTPPPPPAPTPPGVPSAVYAERERLRAAHREQVRRTFEESERLRAEHDALLHRSQVEAARIRTAHEAHVRRANEETARLDRAISRTAGR